VSVNEGWDRYQMLVLDKLDSLDQRLSRVEQGMILVRIDVANLKVKAGIWGGLAGMIPSIIGVTLVLLGGPLP
jgi:hypothetical protein